MGAWIWHTLPEMAAVSDTPSRRELLLVALTALVLIPLASAPAAFGNVSIYLDDGMRYVFGVENKFPWYIGERNFLRPFIMWPLYKLLAVSPDYPRGIITFGFMVPVSIGFFVLLRKALRLPTQVALAAALLPNVLPGQEMIPAFVDGCYLLPGLLLTVLPCLLCLTTALRAGPSHRRTIFSIGAVIFWALGRTTMDATVFLFPVVIFATFFLDGFKWQRQRVMLATAFALVSAYDVVSVLRAPMSANAPTNLSGSEMMSRLDSFLPYATPFVQMAPKADSVNVRVLGIVLVLVVVAGLLVAVLREADPIRQAAGRGGVAFAYSFGLLWAVSMTPFLTVSKYFASRYAYIPAFGVALLIALACASIFHWLFRGMTRTAFGVALLLVLVSGGVRYKALASYYGNRSEYFIEIRDYLSRFDFPKDAQIAFSPHLLPTCGWYHYSSGMFRYLTGRQDIRAIHGEELKFYDPFDMAQQGFVLRMRGLDITKPVFLFRREGRDYVQKEYGLQWIGDSNGTWAIHHFDLKTGTDSVAAKGQGYAEYESTLMRLEGQGLQAKEIMWAGRTDPARISPTVSEP